MLQYRLIPIISICLFVYVQKKGVEESVAESRLMGKQTLGEKQIIAPSPTVEHSVHFVDIIRQQGRCLCHIFIPRSVTNYFHLFQIHLAAQSDQPDVVKLFLQKQPSLVTTTTKVIPSHC